MSKFRIGDRVRFSQKALDQKIGKLSPKDRVGTIAGYCSYGSAVQVRWDGLKSKQPFHEDYLDLVPKAKP